MPSVSCYVTAFRNGDTIAACIRSLKSQTLQPVQLLTVEDDHDEDDPSLEICRRLGVKILLDHGGQNRGLPASINTALKHAEGDVFVKVDGDVELFPLWIEKAAKHLDEDETIHGVCGRLLETHTGTIQGQWRSIFMRQEWGANRLQAPEWLFGAAGCFRTSELHRLAKREEQIAVCKAALQAATPEDKPKRQAELALVESWVGQAWTEKYRFNYQDVDISKRMKSASRLYEPDCVARHLLNSTVPEVMENNWRWFKDPDDRGYESLSSAATTEDDFVPGKKLTRVGCHLLRGISRTQQAIGMGMFNLSYLCLLSGYWCVLEDIDWVRKLGNCDTHKAQATQQAVIDMGYSHLGKMGLPVPVQKRFLEDTAEWRHGNIHTTPESSYLEEVAKVRPTIDPSAAFVVDTAVMAMES